VSFKRDGRLILDAISIQIDRGQHWALLGANGAGKSTLLNICGAIAFPSSGYARILSHRMGQIDLRELRRRIGHVNPRHSPTSNLTAVEVVLTGLTGSIELVPRWEPTDEERARARRLLKMVGLNDNRNTRWRTMSQGERGRALIARALIAEPLLLLLDEPSTGLDVAAREQMIETLAGLPEAAPELTTVTVTHHFEELPPSISHAALLRNGTLVAAGPVDQVLTSDHVSDCFAHQLHVTWHSGRWSVLARRS
jgi:iron complex transport system ATP-binding protein